MVLALTCSGAGAACAPDTPYADVVFVGHFVTLDPGHPEADAIGVRDGRIVAVGSREDLASWMGPDTRQSELPGVALPGFAEGHGHAQSVGEQLEILDLRGLSKQEVLDRVAASAGAAGTGDWIRGKGWDQGYWTPATFPTAADLDRVAPDHPVFLTPPTWTAWRRITPSSSVASTATRRGSTRAPWSWQRLRRRRPIQRAARSSVTGKATQPESWWTRRSI
jgi:hypothetical protein